MLTNIIKTLFFNKKKKKRVFSNAKLQKHQKHLLARMHAGKQKKNQTSASIARNKTLTKRMLYFTYNFTSYTKNKKAQKQKLPGTSKTKKHTKKSHTSPKKKATFIRINNWMQLVIIFKPFWSPDDAIIGHVQKRSQNKSLNKRKQFSFYYILSPNLQQKQ